MKRGFLPGSSWPSPGSFTVSPARNRRTIEATIWLNWSAVCGSKQSGFRGRDFWEGVRFIAPPRYRARRGKPASRQAHLPGKARNSRGFGGIGIIC
jgi:hypothetical protein